MLPRQCRRCSASGLSHHEAHHQALLRLPCPVPTLLSFYLSIYLVHSLPFSFSPSFSFSMPLDARDGRSAVSFSRDAPFLPLTYAAFAECGVDRLLPSFPVARRRRERVRPASLRENPRVMDATFVLFTGFTVCLSERASAPPRRRNERATRMLYQEYIWSGRGANAKVSSLVIVHLRFVRFRYNVV